MSERESANRCSGFHLSLWGQRLLLIASLVAGGYPINSAGHLALYHNIEVNLRDPDVVQLFFTVHAPELSSAIAAGADPAGVGEDWLRNLGDEALAKLIAESSQQVRDTFGFFFEKDSVFSPAKLSARDIRFEPVDRILDSTYDSGLPAGCLLATVTLKNPGTPARLKVALSRNSEKRLLLAVSRPGEFPEVKDLAAGESVLVTLPGTPRRTGGGFLKGVGFFSFNLLGVAFVAILFLVSTWPLNFFKPSEKND